MFFLFTILQIIPLCPGDIAISDISVSVDSILTCISTGGPATNVTWTRGNDEDNLIPDNAQVTVLENATTAQSYPECDRDRFVCCLRMFCIQQQTIIS